MSEQNQNPNPNPNDPADEQPIFTKSEMNAIVQQRLAQDRARRGGTPPAPASSAPAGEDRLARVEATLDRMAGLFERMAPAAASSPQPTQPTTQPTAPVQRAPAAAPNAPAPHGIPTNMGFPDLWNMTPEQFYAFRTTGQLRPTLEAMWAAGARMSGAPPRPAAPFEVDLDGSRVAARGRRR